MTSSRGSLRRPGVDTRCSLISPHTLNFFQAPPLDLPRRFSSGHRQRENPRARAGSLPASSSAPPSPTEKGSAAQAHPRAGRPGATLADASGPRPGPVFQVGPAPALAGAFFKGRRQRGKSRGAGGAHAGLPGLQLATAVPDGAPPGERAGRAPPGRCERECLARARPFQVGLPPCPRRRLSSATRQTENPRGLAAARGSPSSLASASPTRAHRRGRRPSRRPGRHLALTASAGAAARGILRDRCRRRKAGLRIGVRERWARPLDR